MDFALFAALSHGRLTTPRRLYCNLCNSSRVLLASQACEASLCKSITDNTCCLTADVASTGTSRLDCWITSGKSHRWLDNSHFPNLCIFGSFRHHRNTGRICAPIDLVRTAVPWVHQYDQDPRISCTHESKSFSTTVKNDTRIARGSTSNTATMATSRPIGKLNLDDSLANACYFSGFFKDSALTNCCSASL